MISHLTVRHFQSIRKADLELGRFTVVVGPSSSGKSALMRAIKLLANNARGASYVTHGEKTTAVTATVEDGMVTLTRGEGVGEYLLTLNDGQVQRFTKLGGAVPEEIGPFLGVRSKDPIHFAGQFDRPYLLDDTGTEVARTLGDLTNVSVIFAAAREARRRQLSANATLKTREQDSIDLRAQVEQFRTLPAQIAAITEAEAALARVADLATKTTTLTALLSSLEIAHAEAERAAAAATVEPPSFDRIQAAVDRRALFMQTLRSVGQISRTIYEANAQAVEADAEAAELEQQYHGLLTQAGTCPLCGQSTKELARAT